MGDININIHTTTTPPDAQLQVSYFDLEPHPTETNFQSSSQPTSEVNVHDGVFSPTVVSNNPLAPSRDPDTSAKFSTAGDARGGMSDSSVPRHGKQRNSRSQQNNAQRSHSTHPQPSPQLSFENTQHHFLTPTHYPTSPPPHAGYIAQYAQPSPMGAVHSPPPFPYPHTYQVPDGTVNIHAHYHTLSPQHHRPSPVYQYQQEPNSVLHPSFAATRLTPMYPIHQPNAIGQPTSSPQTAQNSPSYMSVFQYPTPMSTPHYTYSPPFSGTPPYQSQYPPPQFGQHYTANRDGEPHGDWYYVPRPSPVPPSQQYDAGPSYSGHYPVAYPHRRPDLNTAYNANSFSSVNSPAYPTPIHTFPQQPESMSPVALQGSVAHTSLSSGSEHNPNEKSIVRQPYHPNPPAHRSEWVMWAGNIPSDATHDEIYRFFSRVPEDSASDPKASMGVVSVFLISRSNCAFVNFESESHLLEAISQFNGIPLRPDDARCPRLVCRVRRKDDDLRAGVGGQRGTGMHTRWVKEQKQKTQEKGQTHDPSDISVSDHSSLSSSSLPDQLTNAVSNLSFSSDDSESGRNLHDKRSSTSDSYSSSNSTFLARHFPKRYFILKSLTEHDLDISVQTGYWATQKHNEGILDQSYRTSKEVYLIFGANKSGEFYGYARMAGPVRRGGQNISWAPSPPRSNQSPTSSRLSSQSSNPIFFSPGDHRLVDSSPSPAIDLKASSDPHLGQQHPPPKHHQSAPGMLGMKYDLPSMKTPQMKFSLDQQQKRFKATGQHHTKNDDFELDPSAPVRAMRSSGGSKGTSLHSLEKVEERPEEPDGIVPEPSVSHEQEEAGEASWGDCFAVEWISTERLPFNRTRQLRNPWNHDREVKVSRDGTELEPTVGQRLLDEWHKLSSETPQPLQSSASAGGMSSQGGSSKSAGSSSKRLVR